MRIAFFDTHSYDRQAFDLANARFGHELRYIQPRLGPDTAELAAGFPAVCAFVNDVLDAGVIETLARGGTRLIALRCAGFNNVDLAAAAAHGLTVLRVPAYSPHAVAEHAIALLLCLNRKLHRAYNRVREGNFALDGLVGFDLYGKTVGVVGTGRIGALFAQIMRGFGCRVLAHDHAPDPALAEAAGFRYVDFATLLAESDIVSLHLPLTTSTRHLIGESAFAAMKPGALLLNTSRGGLIDTEALIRALKSGRIGAAGLDVYEGEAGIFFEDLSLSGVPDDTLARLLSFPNVLVTGHQAFLTDTALDNIAETTLDNARAFEHGEPSPNVVRPATAQPPRP